MVRKNIHLESCDKCGAIAELTICLHFDTMEELGSLCDGCVEEYLKYCHALAINAYIECSHYGSGPEPCNDCQRCEMVEKSWRGEE